MIIINNGTSLYMQIFKMKMGYKSKSVKQLCNQFSAWHYCCWKIVVFHGCKFWFWKVWGLSRPSLFL